MDKILRLSSIKAIKTHKTTWITILSWVGHCILSWECHVQKIHWNVEKSKSKWLITRNTSPAKIIPKNKELYFFQKYVVSKRIVVKVTYYSEVLSEYAT